MSAVGALNAAASVSQLRHKRVKPRAAGENEKAVMTCFIIVIGAGFLHAWIVEKKPAPDRKFLVRITVLGFILALLAEVAPKLGKGMAYLILVATIFDRSQDILKALQDVEGPKAEASGPALGPTLTQASAVEPIVFYQRSGGMNGPQAAASASRPRDKRPRPKAGAPYLL